MPIFKYSREIYFIGEPETEKLSLIKSKTGKVQRYEDIIVQHNAENPFVDEEFPRDDSSLGGIEFDSAQGAVGPTAFPTWDKTYKWKRIKDLCAGTDITFFGDKDSENGKYSRFDIQQGVLGDCWFIAGLAEITHYPQIIEFVVPDDNQNNNDSGAYHFRMAHNGIWIDVVVDDWIPVMELLGPGKEITAVGLKPVQYKYGDKIKTKIWAMLAEKAYRGFSLT